MQPSESIERDRRLAAERSLKYWGTASVKIDILEFPNEEHGENVDRLEELFKKDLRGLNPINRIPAKIAREHLDAALEVSGLNYESLKAHPDPEKGYPELDFTEGFRLQCRRGLHRCKAARRVLPPGARRWTVDLFHLDIDPDLDTELAEEYSAEKPPDDGQLYRKIRKYQGYQGRGDAFLENRWWALLRATSKSKEQNMRQICRNTDFRAAFDIQLDIPGLSGGMKFGSTHEMFAMWCHEQCLHYLKAMREIWVKGICREDDNIMQRIDRPTVSAIEHTSPGSCQKDRELLYGKLQNGQIFGKFNKEERDAIWTRVLAVSTNRLIPSLFTFFEDLRYLEGPVSCLNRLVQRRPGQTISSALLGSFRDINQQEGQCVVQESDSRFVVVPGTERDRADLGERQLWMCAMRDSTDLPPKRKKKKSILLAKPQYKESATALHRMATLAFRSGYDSDQIRNILHDHPDSIMAENALLEARPLDQFFWEPSELEHCKTRIRGLFNTATPRPPQDAITAIELNNHVECPKRYGKPSITERNQTKPFLFANRLHRHEDFGEVTPFFVRKSVYLAFFGMPRFDHINTSLRLTLTNVGQQVEDIAQSNLSALHNELQILEQQYKQRLQEEKKRLSEEAHQQHKKRMEHLDCEVHEKVAERLELERTSIQQKLEADASIRLIQLIEEEKKVKEEIEKKHEEDKKELRKDIQRLRQEIEQLESDKEKMTHLLDQARIHQSQSDEDNKRLEEVNRQADQEKEKLQEAIEALQGDRDKIKNQLDEAMMNTKSSAEEYRQLESRKGEITNLLDQARIHQSQSDEENKRLEENMKALEGINEQLGGEIDRLRSDRDNVKNQLDETVMGAQVSAETIKRLEGEKIQLSERVRSQQFAQDSLRSDLQQTESIAQKSQLLETQIQEGLETLQTVEREKDNIIQQAMNSNQKLESQLADVKKRLEESNHSNSQIREQLKQSDQIRERRKSDMDRREQLLREQKAQQDQDLKDEKSKLDTETAKLLRERNALNNEIQTVTREKEKIKQDWASLNVQKRESKKSQTEQSKNQTLSLQRPTKYSKNISLDFQKEIPPSEAFEQGEMEQEIKVKRRRLITDGDYRAKSFEIMRTLGKHAERERDEEERKRKIRQTEIERQDDKVQHILSKWKEKKGEMDRSSPKKVQHNLKGMRRIRQGPSFTFQDVPIKFIYRGLEDDSEDMVPAAEVERVASAHYRKKGKSIYDTKGRELHPISCYEDVTGDGTNTVIVQSFNDSDIMCHDDSRELKHKA